MESPVFRRSCSTRASILVITNRLQSVAPLDRYASLVRTQIWRSAAANRVPRFCRDDSRVHDANRTRPVCQRGILDAPGCGTRDPLLPISPCSTGAVSAKTETMVAFPRIPSECAQQLNPAAPPSTFCATAGKSCRASTKQFMTTYLLRRPLRQHPLAVCGRAPCADRNFLTLRASLPSKRLAISADA